MIGTGEIIVIMCVILILFGGKKLPEFARSLGLGIREFKKACNGESDELPSAECTVLKKEEHKEPTSSPKEEQR